MANRRTLQRLLLSVAAIGVNLALADAVARWSGAAEVGGSDFLGAELETPDSFLADRDLFWRLAPDNEKWRTSGRSTRGPCPDGAPSDARFRIACVGDSCTFGAGVRYEQAWGVRLARKLDARLAPAAAEPVLLACPGYSLFQCARWYARERAALRPDVTIVYCGAWNDYVAAVGASDAARAASDAAVRGLPPIARLWRKSFGAEAADRDDVRAGFRHDEAPFGRRVALDDFRAGLRELVALARQDGGLALLVVPPLPCKTVRSHAIALDYRAAVASVAAETGAPCLDAAALFDSFIDHCPDGWCTVEERESGYPLFSDWVHPSALGHERIAAALLDLLLAAPPTKLATLLARAAPEAAEIAASPSVATPSLPVLSDATLRLERGPWSGPDRADRFWIGETFVDRVVFEEDGSALLAIPSIQVAGRVAVEARSGDGGRWRGPQVDVVPLPLSARVVRRSKSMVRFALEAEGPPGFRFRVWGATGLRRALAATEAGDFALAAEPDGRPAERPELPFRFEQLTLPCWFGVFGDDGRWRTEFAIEAEPLAPFAAVHFQGLATRAKEIPTATLTAVATVALDG